MIKRCLSIILIIAISTNVVQFVVPVSWYLTNYHHISTELCINKLNLDIECNGMCQLKKRMKSDHDHHTSPVDNSKNIADRNVRIDLFITETKVWIPVSHPDAEIWQTLIDDSYSNWISEPILPPPQFV